MSLQDSRVNPYASSTESAEAIPENSTFRGTSRVSAVVRFGIVVSAIAPVLGFLLAEMFDYWPRFLSVRMIFLPAWALGTMGAGWAIGAATTATQRLFAYFSLFINTAVMGALLWLALELV